MRPLPAGACAGGWGAHARPRTTIETDRAPSVEAGTRGAAVACGSGPALPLRLEVTA